MKIRHSNSNERNKRNKQIDLERDQKWQLDHAIDGNAGLEMPCIILATARGVNLMFELLFKKTCFIDA